MAEIARVLQFVAPGCFTQFFREQTSRPPWAARAKASNAPRRPRH